MKQGSEMLCAWALHQSCFGLRYNPQNLDSSSSLGHVSNASTSESARKSGLWSGLKKMSMSTRPSRAAMPSITEQSGKTVRLLESPVPRKMGSWQPEPPQPSSRHLHHEPDSL